MPPQFNHSLACAFTNRDRSEGREVRKENETKELRKG